MPPIAIKHQLTCPNELTSSSFLIGRRGILVILRNCLVTDIAIDLHASVFSFTSTAGSCVRVLLYFHAPLNLQSIHNKYCLLTRTSYIRQLASTKDYTLFLPLRLHFQNRQNIKILCLSRLRNRKGQKNTNSFQIWLSFDFKKPAMLGMLRWGRNNRNIVGSCTCALAL